MFKNIISKIRICSYVIYFIGILYGLVSFILSITYDSSSERLFYLISCILSVCLCTFISFIVYGFAELIENTKKMANNSSSTQQSNSVQVKKISVETPKSQKQSIESSTVEEKKYCEKSSNDEEVTQETSDVVKAVLKYIVSEYRKQYGDNIDKNSLYFGEKRTSELKNIANEELTRVLIELQNRGYIICENIGKSPLGFIALIEY